MNETQKMEQTLLHEVRQSTWRKRIFSYVVLFTMLFQNALYSSQAAASVLQNAIIERDFVTNPFFMKALENVRYQYIENQHLGTDTTVGQSIADFQAEANLNFTGAFIPRYIGSPKVQERYVRYQIQTLLGRNLIDLSRDDFANEQKQIETLYANAKTYLQNNPDKVLGENLNLEQDGSGLDADMIWPESRMIHGEWVLVPIVYLTEATVTDRRVVDHQVNFGGDASFSHLFIDDVSVRFIRDAYLQASGISNTEGDIIGSGNLSIELDSSLENISGVISANNDLNILANGIENRTLVHRFDLGNQQGGSFGEVAEITAGGDLMLDSHSNIFISGGNVTAGGAITLDAGGNIFVGGEQFTRARQFGENSESVTRYLRSRIEAENDISLVSDGEIFIDAAELVSHRGHIELLAELGITIEDDLISESYERHRKYRKETVDIEAYKTVAMRSLLDAGKNITLHSEHGDIILKATEITSQDGTNVYAKDGAVNMLMTVENDYYSYQSLKENTFTVTNVSRGHNIETGIQNSIVGGFAVEALYGVKVEYAGAEDKTFDGQIENFRNTPDLAWIAELRDNPDVDVDWNEVELVYEEWNDRSKSLNAAAIALIVVVLTVVTAGAAAAIGNAVTGAVSGAGAATSAGAAAVSSTAATVTSAAATAGATATATAAASTLASAIGAAAQAAFVSAVTTSGIAFANTLVNGEGLDDALRNGLESVASSEGLKSLATAAITAGVISAVNTQFFSPSEAELNAAAVRAEDLGRANNLTGSALTKFIQEGRKQAFALSRLEQIGQVVTHATVRAGVSTLINGGDLDLENVLQSSLTSYAVNSLGQVISSEIIDATKNSDFEKAFELIAHASSGCFVQEVLNDSCEAGALGSATSVLISNAYNVTQSEEVEGVLKDELEFIDAQLAEGKTPFEVALSLDTDFTYYGHRLSALEQQGVAIAKIGAGFAAILANKNVDSALASAETASANVISRFARNMLHSIEKEREETELVGPKIDVEELSALAISRVSEDAIQGFDEALLEDASLLNIDFGISEDGDQYFSSNGDVWLLENGAQLESALDLQAKNFELAIGLQHRIETAEANALRIQQDADDATFYALQETYIRIAESGVLSDPQFTGLTPGGRLEFIPTHDLRDLPADEFVSAVEETVWNASLGLADRYSFGLTSFGLDFLGVAPETPWTDAQINLANDIAATFLVDELGIDEDLLDDVVTGVEIVATLKDAKDLADGIKDLSDVAKDYLGNAKNESDSGRFDNIEESELGDGSIPNLGGKFGDRPDDAFNNSPYQQRIQSKENVDNVDLFLGGVSGLDQSTSEKLRSDLLKNQDLRETFENDIELLDSWKKLDELGEEGHRNNIDWLKRVDDWSAADVSLSKSDDSLKLLDASGSNFGQVKNGELIPETGKYFDTGTPKGDVVNGYQVVDNGGELGIRRVPDRSAYDSSELTELTQHPRAHVLERHGHDVPDEALIKRANEGIAPDGSNIGDPANPVPPPYSSKFENTDQLKLALENTRPGTPAFNATPVDNGKKIVFHELTDGSSYGKGVPKHGNVFETATKVRAVYHEVSPGNFELFTMFPDF